MQLTALPAATVQYAYTDRKWHILFLAFACR